MAEGLMLADGTPIDVEAVASAFSAAMAAPPADRPGLDAPARKPPMPEADPETAPHGWMFDGGEWRPKKAPGRQAKPRTDAEKPRVVDGPPAGPAPKKAAPAKAAGPAKDYRKVVQETIEGIWFALATVPVPDMAFGKRLTGLRTRLRVQAALIEQSAGELVGGITTVATHNRFVAQALDRMASGESGLWILPAVSMLAPFVAATGQLWSGKLGTEEELEKLAAKTEESAVEWVQVQMQAAAAA